jgi:hypothetical protein
MPRALIAIIRSQSSGVTSDNGRTCAMPALAIKRRAQGRLPHGQEQQPAGWVAWPVSASGVPQVAGAALSTPKVRESALTV